MGEATNFFSALAAAVLALHGVFILWVRVWRSGDAVTPSIALAAHRLARLGNLDGAAPVALPSDSAGELARGESRDFAIPGRVPTSLSR